MIKLYNIVVKSLELLFSIWKLYTIGKDKIFITTYINY